MTAIEEGESEKPCPCPTCATLRILRAADERRAERTANILCVVLYLAGAVFLALVVWTARFLALRGFR